MTVRDIHLFGDPVLRTPAKPVRTFDKRQSARHRIEVVLTQCV